MKEKTLTANNAQNSLSQQKTKIFARKAEEKTVTQALPQPGGADILKAKRALRCR